jgi:hypothetical protein
MKHFSSKLVLFLVASCGFLSFFVGKKTTNEPKESSNSPSSGVAVLELYTSEGCSSCPPADDILRGVAAQENIFALAFHVTYWNRLGWKDSFSQKIFDERQSAYASSFQKEGVYTPQLIVNGTEEFVGSRKSTTGNAIKKALAIPTRVQIELTKTLKGNDIAVKYKLVGDFKDAQLNFAVVESGFSTKVIRGENEGLTLKHDNVVRDFEVSEAKYTEGVLEVYPLKNWRIQNCAAIVFLQDKKTRQVLGATKIRLN